MPAGLPASITPDKWARVVRAIESERWEPEDFADVTTEEVGAIVNVLYDTYLWSDWSVEYDFVTERIATGGAIYRASDVDTLIADGITHIATMAIELEDDTERFIGGRLPHLKNGVPDDGLFKPTAWFKRTLDFTLDALKDPTAKVYIHCGAGINRGPSGAYVVLRALGMTPSEAYWAIALARPEANGGILYASQADRALREIGG